MRRVAAGLALALAACGGDPENVNGVADGNEGAAVPAVAGSAATPPAPAGGLVGQVSGLRADVSGLNTRMSDMGLVIDLPADALFDFDEATLTPAAETELAKAAEVIRAAPAGAIRVVGHTDARGDDAYNQRLSEARAATVRDWFAGQVGVRQRAFEIAGRGEAEPIAPNARPDGDDDPQGRARNRRVEVIVPTG